MRSTHQFALYIAIVGFVIAGVCGCASGPAVGKQAPDFRVTDNGGDALSLGNFEGKILVCYFWATWCAPCVVASPQFQAIHDAYADEDVVVLGVHFNDTGNPRDYMKAHNYTFKLIPDGYEMAQVYGVSKIPQVVIIGDDGTILFRQTGIGEGDGDRIAAVLDENLPPAR